MAGLPVTPEELRALLVQRLELLDEGAFAKAQSIATRLRVPLERALVERARIPLAFMLEQLAQAWSVGYVDLKLSEIQREALATLPEDYARAHALLPFGLEGKELRVALCDPRDRRTLDEIQRLTNLRVLPCLAHETAVRRAQLLYKPELWKMLERSATDETLTIVPAERPGAEARGVVDLVQRILEYAAVTGASDIHIEPYELEMLVRYRIDGVLQEVLTLPTTLLSAVVARIKILSSLRVDERRAPQDGRFEADLGGFKIDLRVSTLPTHWGEKVVMRVLVRESVLLDLEDLGLSSSDFEKVVRNATRPYGMILNTGPTGSGKTTTLYAMLIRVGAERMNLVNISTIEDPVEYTVPRINQTAVNVAAGVEFSSGLRALLRQDPDIIMVGEIRDRDTAEIAIRSALVGRLLLSTLHTNDATGAIPRLLDMGIEPFLVASTLALVMAQRLVRRICMSCRESLEPDPLLLKALRARSDFEQTVNVLQQEGVLRRDDDPLAGARLFRGKGCPQCHGSGFRGRLGVFELLEVDDDIRSMIMERKDATAIRTVAIAKGMKTMLQDGLAKALLGETMLEEVFRVAL